MQPQSFQLVGPLLGRNRVLGHPLDHLKQLRNLVLQLQVVVLGLNRDLVLQLQVVVLGLNRVLGHRLDHLNLVRNL